MPWVSRISDDRQTLAFSRALISFSPLLQTPLNFIQANSLTLRKSSFFSKVSEGLEPETTGLRVCGRPRTKRPDWNSLRASSPVWASRSEPKRERASEGRRKAKGFAARSRVLARLASLFQIGELARRLDWKEKRPSGKRNGLSTPRKNAANG